MRELLPVYKEYDGVPLYLYPDNVEEIRQYILERFGSVKRARSLLRNELRCFLSENAIWRRIIRVDVDTFEPPPAEPRLSLAVVMARGTRPDFDYVKYLESKGLSVNPYSFASRECIGFYCKNDFSIIDRVLSELAERKLIRDAMIVNGVWYAKLGRPVNLARLVDSGVFVPSTSKAFKLANGVVGTAKVAVFHTGTVRIVRALTPEQARDVLGRVYGLLRAYGAI